MTERRIDVVHIGSASRDLTEDDPRGWRLGGGASYAALATARLGLRTAAIVGVDPMAATASELDLLREAGVEVLSVPLAEGPVFRNVETPAGRVQAWPVHGRLLPIPALPPSWLEARAWSLVPVASELDDAWTAAIPARAIVSVGWQGLLRTQGPHQVTHRRQPARDGMLARADLVGLSRDDLVPGTPLGELAGLLKVGARLAVTGGHDGGQLLTVLADDRVAIESWRAVSPARVVDPTGAGDVFLAALLAATVRPDLATIGAGGPPSPTSAIRFAAVAASFAVEEPGLGGVPDIAAVRARLTAA